MNHYFKLRWDESRGDDYKAWGCSLWLFETDEEFWPIRQIEIYDGGQALFYDQKHDDDQYGGLGQAALEPEDVEGSRITREEFEHAWSMHKPINRM